jgi:hypothetical protein
MCHGVLYITWQPRLLPAAGGSTAKLLAGRRRHALARLSVMLPGLAVWVHKYNAWVTTRGGSGVYT